MYGAAARASGERDDARAAERVEAVTLDAESSHRPGQLPENPGAMPVAARHASDATHDARARDAMEGPMGMAEIIAQERWSPSKGQRPDRQIEGEGAANRARDLFRFTARRYSGSTWQRAECNAEGSDIDGYISKRAKKPHNVPHSRAGHEAGTLDTIDASSTWIPVQAAQKRPDRNSGYRLSCQAKRGVRQRLFLAWAQLHSRASSVFQCRVLGTENRQKQAARS